MKGTETVEVRFRFAKPLHKKLKEQARREHRSLNSQVEYLLERAAESEKAGAAR